MRMPRQRKFGCKAAARQRESSAGGGVWRKGLCCLAEGSMPFGGRVCGIEMTWSVSIHQILPARYPEEQKNASVCWNLAEFRLKFGWHFVLQYP